MNNFYLKGLKLVFLSLLVLFFTSCSHKTSIINGGNDFHSLTSELVKKSASKIKNYVGNEEVILVSDFVNLDNLKNRSELGFLLSDMLKDSLVSENILVKAVELGKEFEFGRNGFTLLTRDFDKIASNKISTKYAVVGTYSITSKSLNVFIKLIDIRTGYILSSSYERTDVDSEIFELETSNQPTSTKEEVRVPHMVL